MKRKSLSQGLVFLLGFAIFSCSETKKETKYIEKELNPPKPPSELVATAVSSTQIDLSWVDNSGNEKRFELWRRSEGEIWGLLSELPADTVSYSDTGLSAETEYFYQIRACNKDGCSNFSEIASAGTQPAPISPPEAPGGLSASALSSSQILLTWQDNSDDEEGFKIERDEGAGFQEIATVPANQTSYLDENLTPATTYTYRIKAYNSAGESEYSNTAQATTLEALASCQGICGGQSPSGCWCDPDCWNYGDCCEDVCDACGYCGANCIDADGDGYYTDPRCGNVDCDDSDPNNWTSCSTCTDADGDGYRGRGCDLSEDCDDSDPQNWVSCAICIDADGDGYRGTGCDISQDCDDSDANNWTKCSTCKDTDGDGWYVDCDQYSTINGSDCDDSDPNNWSSCSTCQDSDGDGKRGTGCDLSEDCDDSDPQNWISCSTCQDVDGDGHRGTGCDVSDDCDDNDVNNWISCANCKDNDGDSWYVGCDSYTSIQGVDCNDSDPNNWTKCSTCKDTDGDGWYVNCDRYYSISGPDCDDTSFLHWQDCGQCQDWDGDGRGFNCDAGPDNCDNDPYNWTQTGCWDCVDEDLDGYRGTDCDIPEDCDDTDPNNWTLCDMCDDHDGDGWYSQCNTYNTILGPDCNDSSPAHWQDCGVCEDLDGDGYGINGTDCDLYKANDCDDNQWRNHPGAPEVCDGEDNNCDGNIDEDEVVIFADPNLEMVVRGLINKPSGDIYNYDLCWVEELWADAYNISELGGIEYFFALNYLGLTGNNLTDISSLSYLINLNYLYLDYNQIRDISPLKGLTNLTELGLEENQISDLSPLSNLTKLRYLNLDFNFIHNLEPLKGLTDLTTLYLYDNHITDLQPLVDNPGLDNGDWLDVKDNPLSDDACNIQIPELEARGVRVDHYCP